MNTYNTIPYISLSIATIILSVITCYITDSEIKNILINIISNAVFFFLVFIFYELIQVHVTKEEKKYLKEYIKNSVSNDIFIALYNIQKILHGYNLDSNTFSNIVGLVNYSENEISNLIKNQSYLGFQIFKNNGEIRDLFKETINNNLFLTNINHIDSINILKIQNKLLKLELIFQNTDFFKRTAENAIEYSVVNGRELNPINENKFLLLKKTASESKFVVYDHGFFEENFKDKLLFRYMLKPEYIAKVSHLLYEIFSLMKYWLPTSLELSPTDSRFRIIKDYFTPFTYTKTNTTKVHVADILELRKNI
ncbi:hypothetical protein [Leptospira sp. GIMC2001]|uniref:hypothetical protein n=1 Tax=Leptospira sp. GIMC2001 TaxID=1513297 RepID=UPI002349FC74|nr:hypothetical protein [Leptospira sp. GIMC2001]WCL50688.1 hypothetical protein O4O04_07725 [Leptospira sp. GIMC2001]